MAETRNYQCPHCAAAVEVAPAATAQVISCPQCGVEMEIPGDEQHTPEITPHEADLNARRIQYIAQSRRAIYRSRSYFIIVAIACFVGALQLSYMAIDYIRAAGITGRPIAYFIFAFVSLVAASACWRRAIALHREAKKPALAEPEVAPDFSTLNSGSDQWKNLEDVR